MWQSSWIEVEKRERCNPSTPLISEVPDMVEVLDTIDLPSKGLGDNPTGLLVTYMGGGKATIAVSAQNLDAALGPLKDSAN